ncbi:MAG: GFA family protein [Gammaproteobacteria bacterium]
MKYQGSCHCGRIDFEVEGEITQVADCNCSMCRRRGGLLWFVPRENLRLRTPEADLGTYTFNTHHLKHHYCPKCGIAPFSDGEKAGKAMAAVNVRCLEGVDISTLKVNHFDGRSL